MKNGGSFGSHEAGVHAIPGAAGADINRLLMRVVTRS
jgi:hypothetical protein